MKIAQILCGLVAGILGIEGAQAAEWIYKKEDKAFGDLQATAMAVGDESVVFIHCEDGLFSVNLATPEDWDDDKSPAMNLLGPKIILAIDGGAPESYGATFTENRMHKILVKIDDLAEARKAADGMRGAKKKIEIGVELTDKRFYASKISTSGAAKKIALVLEACVEKP